VGNRRTLRRIEMCRAAINRNGMLDFAGIEHVLADEFREWEARLLSERARVDAALYRMDHPLAPEEAAERRRLYRRLSPGSIQT